MGLKTELAVVPADPDAMRQRRVKRGRTLYTCVWCVAPSMGSTAGQEGDAPAGPPPLP